MLTVVLRRRQKFWFLTKKIAVLTAFQHQKSSLFLFGKPSLLYMMITVACSLSIVMKYMSELPIKERDR